MPVIKCLVLRAEKALGRRVFVSASLLVFLFLFLSHPSGIFVCLHLRIDKRKGGAGYGGVQWHEEYQAGDMVRGRGNEFFSKAETQGDTAWGSIFNKEPDSPRQC